MRASLSVEPKQFWDFPANAFVKNLSGVFLWGNRAVLQMCRLHKLKEYIGKNDFSFSKKKEAEVLRYNDQLVIKGNAPQYFDEPCSLGDVVIKYKSYKMPLYNASRNIIGVFGIAVPIDWRKSDFPNVLFRSLERMSIYNKQKNSVMDGLTKREMVCVQMIAMGKTAKEIGRFLSISPRTVESYIVSVKNKTGCLTKSELIDLYWFYMSS